MLVPVIQTSIQRLGQFVQVLKTVSLQSQGAQLLPPRLDQVQPTSILGNELQLHFRPGGQSQLDLPTDVNRQVILDDQPTVGRKGEHDFLQQLNVAGTVSSGTEQRNRLSSGWLKGTMHPQLSTSSIIGFKDRPVWTDLPFFSGICFDRNRSHFIHTDHPGAWKRGQVSRYDAPLFSTNSGSCFSASWNQLCWRFHLNPSPSTHSQMVESDK